MSEQEAGVPEGAPALVLKAFCITFQDPDEPMLYLGGISGSNLDGGLLFLITPAGREMIINMQAVRSIVVTDNDDESAL